MKDVHPFWFASDLLCAARMFSAKGLAEVERAYDVALASCVRRAADAFPNLSAEDAARAWNQRNKNQPMHKHSGPRPVEM